MPKRPRSLEDVASLITEKKARRIIVMTGAGISTAAGIPDFRSPETGLYANLQKFNLPFPEAIFELGYFKAKPQAFYQLAKELYPGNFRPTLTHYFFALLDEKGLLLREYTQNIDCLSSRAGVSTDKLVEAHGSFATSTCLRCKHQSTGEEIKSRIEQQEVVRCERKGCKGRNEALIKPNIIFFGEGLPDRFHRLYPVDFRKADLLLVLGTSLQVYPFAGLVDACDCPKVLINLERVPSWRDFDVVKLGKADEAILELADHLGWKHELLLLQESGNASLNPSQMNKLPAAEKATETAEKIATTESAEEEIDTISKAVDNVKLDDTREDKEGRPTLAAKVDVTKL